MLPPLCCGLQYSSHAIKVIKSVWLPLAGVFLSGMNDSLAASAALLVHSARFGPSANVNNT